MSDNKYNIKNYKSGENLQARDLRKIADATKSIPLQRNYAGLTKNGPTGQTFTPHFVPSPGSSSTVLLTLKSFATGVYTADIITSPTDATVLTANVKAKLLEGASNESSIVGDDVFSSITYTETILSVEQDVYYFSVPVVK